MFIAVVASPCPPQFRTGRMPRIVKREVSDAGSGGTPCQRPSDVGDWLVFVHELTLCVQPPLPPQFGATLRPAHRALQGVRSNQGKGQLWLIIFNEFSVCKWQRQLIHDRRAKQTQYPGARLSSRRDVQRGESPLLLTDNFEARKILFP